MGERRGTGFTPRQAWEKPESVRAVTDLLGLTAAQTCDSERRYAYEGGIGARLYDRLIGEAALAHGLTRIVTWRLGHMRGLFPSLAMITPAGALAD